MNLYLSYRKQPDRGYRRKGKTMKRFILILLAISLFVPAAICTADTIHVDTETSSDEEIKEAYQLLRDEYVNRLKKIIPPANSDNNGLFLFRSVPWYSTREETEKIIGYKSNTKGPSSEIYRIEKMDYPYSVSGPLCIKGNGGVFAYYSGVDVAGLIPSETYITYIYPIVDGTIIHEDKLSQIYMAHYKFKKEDFGDHEGIYQDFQRKLNNTYGEGIESTNGYSTWTLWTDREGNIIRLYINKDKNYVSLGYMAGDADERLDEMIIAMDNEKANEDKMNMEINEDNYNGL